MKFRYLSVLALFFLLCKLSQGQKISKAKVDSSENVDHIIKFYPIALTVIHGSYIMADWERKINERLYGGFTLGYQYFFANDFTNFEDNFNSPLSIYLQPNIYYFTNSERNELKGLILGLEFPFHFAHYEKGGWHDKLGISNGNTRRYQEYDDKLYNTNVTEFGVLTHIGLHLTNRRQSFIFHQGLSLGVMFSNSTDKGKLSLSKSEVPIYLGYKLGFGIGLHKKHKKKRV